MSQTATKAASTESLHQLKPSNAPQLLPPSRLMEDEFKPDSVLSAELVGDLPPLHRWASADPVMRADLGEIRDIAGTGMRINILSPGIIAIAAARPAKGGKCRARRCCRALYRRAQVARPDRPGQ